MLFIKRQDSIALATYEATYQAATEIEAQENWEMIKADYPTLSEEQIKENIELVDEYYLRNIDYVVLDEIAINGEEIANKVAQKRKTYSKVVLDGKECGGIVAFIHGHFLSLVPVIGGLLAVSNAKKAGEGAESSAARYYGKLDKQTSSNRRDAYKHLMWNALMAKYYFSLIPSIRIRTDFAKKVAKAYELCGGNALDETAMDKHNNVIGRKIYDDNTTYRRFLGIPVGLREPSNPTLERIAKDYVENKSCYIVKEADGNDFNGNKIDPLSDSEVRTYIQNTDVHTVVYYNGPVAHGYYWTFSHWDYTGCLPEMKGGKQARNIGGGDTSKGRPCPFPRNKNKKYLKDYKPSSLPYNNVPQ